MTKKIALIFPGQGVQKVGMGRDFFQQYPKAKERFQEADEVLGRALTHLIFEGPEEDLMATHNSQVALFVTSMALWDVVSSQFPQLEVLASGGLSLGEYTALAATGRLSFSEALALVQARGQYMSDACKAEKGGMSVVIGLEPNVVEELVAPIQGLWAANFNCPGQVVISGTVEGVELGASRAKELGARAVMPLKVHGAFHSGLMERAGSRLEPHIMEVLLNGSRVQLAMNVPGTLVEDADEIRRNLILQVTHPVRWEANVHAMSQLAVEAFLEVGPGKTLTGMNRRIGVPQKSLTVEVLADLEKLGAEL